TLTNQGLQNANPVPDLGVVEGNNTIAFPGTVFDNLTALRSITDPQNTAPFIGVFKPEQSSLQVFAGLTPQMLAGTWEVDVVDNFNENGNNNPLPDGKQYIQSCSLRFNSRLANQGGSESFIGLAAEPSSINQVYPTVLPAAGANGVGPNISVAVDNTLGGFTQQQGNM